MGQNLDELFDVVDAADRVIGQATRREVHARGWRHRAVHVFIVNRAGKIFLHQRSLAKDTFPGLWNSSCAGHVAAGDGYDVTVLRELEEELGLLVDTATAMPRRLFRVDPCAETGQEFLWVYRVEAEGPFTLNAREIQRGHWFASAEIDAWVARAPAEFADSFVFLWPRVRELL